MRRELRRGRSQRAASPAASGRPGAPRAGGRGAARLTMEKSVHAICSVGTMTMAGNILSPLFRRVIQNTAESAKQGSMRYMNQPLNCVVRGGGARSRGVLSRLRFSHPPSGWQLAGQRACYQPGVHARASVWARLVVAVGRRAQQHRERLGEQHRLGPDERRKGGVEHGQRARPRGARARRAVRVGPADVGRGARFAAARSPAVNGQRQRAKGERSVQALAHVVARRPAWYSA